MDNTSICKICVKQQANYKCPRCLLDYCSLDCYKGELHLKCSEQFYKAEVMNELNATDDCDKSKRSVETLLDELSFLDSVPADVEESEVPHTEIIDLDSGVSIYNQLSLKDQKLFAELLKTGKASLFLPKLEPWWLVLQSDRLKASIETRSFTSIFQGKPSDNLPYHCCNIVFVYCFTYRLFNGDFYDLPDEVCNIINRCCVLGNRSLKFSCVAQAIWGTVFEIQSLYSQYLQMVPASKIVHDVQIIVSSKELRTYLLSDLHSICSKLKSVFGSKESKKMQHSIEFFLSWMESEFCPIKTWKTIASELLGVATDFIELDNCKIPEDITRKIRSHVNKFPKVEVVTDAQ